MNCSIFRLRTWSEGPCRLRSPRRTTWEKTNSDNSRWRCKRSTAWRTGTPCGFYVLASRHSYSSLPSSSTLRSGSSLGVSWSRSPTSWPDSSWFSATAISCVPRVIRRYRTLSGGCSWPGGENSVASLVLIWTSIWSCRNTLGVLLKVIFYLKVISIMSCKL